MWRFEEDDPASSSDNNRDDQSPEPETPNYLLRHDVLGLHKEDELTSISSSPQKKVVQFQIGGGEQPEDEQQDGLQLQTLNETGTGSNRAEKSDYVAAGSTMGGTGTGGATIVPLLLPAIAEEKVNGSRRPQYSHSVSMVDTVKYGSANADTVPTSTEHMMYGFVELDVLTGDTGADLSNREWKETTRWIKYEENLEGGGRWGKPHLASLSFHSLIKLRQLIDRDGIVMLDMEEHDMPGIAYRVVEEVSAKGLIRPDESPLLMRLLLLRHIHVQENAQWFGLKRTNTSAVSLQSLYDKGLTKGKPTLPMTTDPCVLVRRNSSMIKTSSPVDIKPPPLQRTASGNFLKPPVAASCPVTGPVDYSSGELKDKRKESYAPSVEDLKWISRRDTMARILPNNSAEATMIMVGEFDAINKPIFVFARLAEPQYMFNITEIPVPARFFSILLAPTSVEMDIIEIGRAFGGLMSNKNFFDLARTATTRKSLTSGINEFLDDSIVLPPGDWDLAHDLLPIHVLKKKTKAIRMRRLKKQISFVRHNDSFVDGMALLPQPPDECDTKGDSYDPFKRTGRLFGGLVNDVRKRFPFYISDFTDACNFQCISTICFMYFASIGLIVTFAGLMGEKTNNLIGMSETLTATAVAGVVFSLIGGQPLIPMGPTGALLVFDEILFNSCRNYGLEFLPLRAWISAWLVLITFIVVAMEGSVLVKWFTKFTQDIFAALTALLLIFESVDNLVEIYENHPLAAPEEDGQTLFLQLNSTNYSVTFEETPSSAEIFDGSEILTAQPNTALLSTILMLGTFFLAFFLKEFRNSVFLGERTRRALGDFGVPIAISTMVFLDVLITDTYTGKVKVPDGFQPSSPEERGWLINPMGRDGDFSFYVALGAIVPAILLFILMFMSQQICELLISSKERHLQKGSGFHFDILVVSIINLIAGFFGAPWLCCATVRALGHVTALTVYSKNHPPGEKPKPLKVHEQRVTNLAVSILVGCSVLLGPLLQLIPMAVLFGVFLYMGVTSLAATQLCDRFSLIFIPAESHPQTVYVRKTPTWKMHLFTAIQISCLALLWLVKSIKSISIAFPLFFILLVPIRLQMTRFYTDSELEALDGKPPT